MILDIPPILNERMKLEKLAGKFSPIGAQVFVNKMPYDYETAYRPGRYMIRSPKRALERGMVICIDGALLLAALTGMDPKIMSMYNSKEGHAVLVTRNSKTGLYGALGQSKHPHLKERPEIFPDEKALAKSYGNVALAYDVVNVATQIPDWMTTDENLHLLIDHPVATRTKKFCKEYITNNYLRCYSK